VEAMDTDKPITRTITEEREKGEPRPSDRDTSNDRE
jgi:hypothetical protein